MPRPLALAPVCQKELDEYAVCIHTCWRSRKYIGYRVVELNGVGVWERDHFTKRCRDLGKGYAVVHSSFDKQRHHRLDNRRHTVSARGLFASRLLSHGAVMVIQFVCDVRASCTLTFGLINCNELKPTEGKRGHRPSYSDPKEDAQKRRHRPCAFVALEFS